MDRNQKYSNQAEPDAFQVSQVNSMEFHPQVEDVRNTINQRMNGFMFNPYLSQPTVGTMTPSSRAYGEMTRAKYEDRGACQSQSTQVRHRNSQYHSELQYLQQNSPLFHQDDDVFADPTQRPPQSQPQSRYVNPSQRPYSALDRNLLFASRPLQVSNNRPANTRQGNTIPSEYFRSDRGTSS
tara:strand:- start:501 stop:1046 length:546 start_codon:yes stop_codon:yes gene_type:complete